VIPGPRPSQGHPRPDAGRDRGHDALRPVRPVGAPEASAAAFPADAGLPGSDAATVALARTPAGWSVISPAGEQPVDGLVEGLSLADLVAEEFGELPEPDRTARRSARGAGAAAEEHPQDPVDARIAALERTVAQLEHALAARVSTERAIGVLSERNGISARAAFELLRRDARSHGRPVAELAREVLDSLPREDPRSDGEAVPAVAPAAHSPAALSPVAPLSRHRDAAASLAAGDGDS
jgi:hypothetical protein